MKLFKNSILAATMLILGACSSLDINENPVQAVTASSDLRLAAIESNMAYHLYSIGRFSSYHSFYVTSRYTSNEIECKWNYNEITRMGTWRWHYFDVGSNVNGLIEQAESEGSNNYLGVAKIMMAFSYLTATDVFGDMPYSEAYSASYNPIYDTQEEVYAGVASLIDEGIESLQNINSAAVTMDASSDLIYGGDLVAWQAFAEAVRARMLLHTANFDDGYEDVLSAVNTALIDFEDAILEYPEDPANDYEMNMWGPSIPYPAWNFADIVNTLNTSLPTDVLMNALTVSDTEDDITYDPRLFKLTSQGNNGVYNGALSTEGLLEGTTYEDYADLHDGYWTADNSPYPYILTEELYFIKAEAAFYLSQSETAYQAYLDGIETNMTRLGISGDEIADYLASDKVVQSAAALEISDIMMQKWIALYLQAETWVDMRRYGYSTNAYPTIYYPENVLDEWNGEWIQRFPYDPQTEDVYNPNEIARLGADARDWCFTDVWWAENSTLKN